jgi:hypothetical protein
VTAAARHRQTVIPLCLVSVVACIEPRGSASRDDAAPECLGELDCKAESCLDYRSHDRREDASSAYLDPVEGVCGGYVFRVTGYYYARTTHYWNAASGTNVAIHRCSDTSAYCDQTSNCIGLGDLEVLRSCQASADRAWQAASAFWQPDGSGPPNVRLVDAAIAPATCAWSDCDGGAP